jgi:hypothetical protein
MVELIKRFSLIAVVVGLLLLAVVMPNLVENLDASEVMVVQSLTGELNVYTTPGPKWQGAGKVTTYPRQAQYSFCSDNKGALCEGANSPSKKLRFNDGGHANLNGFVMWEMPLDEKSIIEIHKRFGSPESVQNRAVAKMIDGAVYLAGPLMSSTESSGSRRSELVQVINDQAENGVYVTHSENVTIIDPVTKEQKTDTVVKIAVNDNGTPKRQQGSVLAELNIKLQPLSISDLKYDDIVEKQIKQRQEATTAVQIAVANSIRAQQDAKTAEAQGQAKAATAKWAQEVIKATEVTKGEQAVAVATLEAKAAEQTKQAQILLGQGEAERKRLVMSADGALDKKLEAIVTINKNYADAIKEAKPGAWTPSVVMGSNGGNAGGATALVDLLTARAAKDAGVDLSVVKR